MSREGNELQPRTARHLVGEALGVRDREIGVIAAPDDQRGFGEVREGLGGCPYVVGRLLEELQQYLATSGRSQAVVAEELGVSRQYLSTVLSGKRPMSPAMEKRISDLLQRASTLPLPLE